MDPTWRIGPNFQGVRIDYRKLEPVLIERLVRSEVHNLPLVYFGISDADLARADEDERNGVESPPSQVLQALKSQHLPAPDRLRAHLQEGQGGPRPSIPTPP